MNKVSLNYITIQSLFFKEPVQNTTCINKFEAIWQIEVRRIQKNHRYSEKVPFFKTLKLIEMFTQVKNKSYSFHSAMGL